MWCAYVLSYLFDSVKSLKTIIMLGSLIKMYQGEECECWIGFLYKKEELKFLRYCNFFFQTV